MINNLIEEIRIYGIEHDVPIMSKESINTIQNIIKENNIQTILEIGTAIAYSTINFALVSKHITSIERDNERYSLAFKNVQDSNLQNITLIHDDAYNVDFKDQKFDLIIIDAAKSQNRGFFDKFKQNLSPNGILIIDNLDFHGYVGKSNEIKSRNLRQMVRKIEKFLEFLDTNEEFNVEYIEVGDRLGICKRK